MATNFPGSLDAFTNPSSSDTLDNPPHDQQHADVNDAVEALQAKVGVDGSAVTSSLDYRVAGVEQALSSRNLLYNGAMQVAQRGTSVSGVSAAGYQTVDRWTAFHSGAGTFTISQAAEAPTGSGFATSWKWLVTTATAPLGASAACIPTQVLEGQDLQHLLYGTPAARELTLSFWVRSNVTGTYIAELELGAKRVSAAYTVTTSGVWQKVAVTFPGNTVDTIANNNAAGIALRMWLAAGSDYSSGTLATTWASVVADRAVGQVNVAGAVNNYWQVTGVQLEVGPQATPFEHLPYGVELAKCQRYHFTLNNAGSTTGTLGYGGVMIANSTGNVPVECPVTMRAKPTAVGTVGAIQLTDGYAFGANVTSIAITSNSTTENVVFVQAGTASSGFTVGRVAYLIASTDATARLGFSAEL